MGRFLWTASLNKSVKVVRSMSDRMTRSRTFFQRKCIGQGFESAHRSLQKMHRSNKSGPSTAKTISLTLIALGLRDSAYPRTAPREEVTTPPRASFWKIFARKCCGTLAASATSRTSITVPNGFFARINNPAIAYSLSRPSFNCLTRVKGPDQSVDLKGKMHTKL